LTGRQVRWRGGCIGLIVLIACTLALDIQHGIALGQDHVGFHPIYRLRQGLAIAISRIHRPSPGGYLASGSVVNVFNENGFALFDDEPGPHLGLDGWEALLTDGPRLDRIIAQAISVPIDAALPPQLMRANELGLADYISLSFKLFGDRVASLYYLFYLIVLTSCLLYVLQFRSSPFLLFLLVVFAAELYFLENYASSFGVYIETVSNSRLFSGLSLLPAMHILLVLWLRLPFRGLTAAAVVGQSLIFTFLLSCRTEVAWQLAMIIAVALGIGLFALRRPPAKDGHGAVARLAVLWPAVVCVVVASAYSATIDIVADQRYAVEERGHIIWHEVVQGLLATSPDLWREYVGDPSVVLPDPDSAVYVAVLGDLKARHDFTSPIIRWTAQGQPVLDVFSGSGEYDRLARSLALRIILKHPLAVIAGFRAKIRNQIMVYNAPTWHPMAWANLRVAAALIALGSLICLVAGGFKVDVRAAARAAAVIAIVLAFAAVTPLIEANALSIGTLFSYLGAFVIVIAFAVALVIHGLSRLVARRRSDPALEVGAAVDARRHRRVELSNFAGYRRSGPT
jgi:hypothetical protein